MPLYIPFYFANKLKRKKAYLLVCTGWALLWASAYVFILDKSTYEMNNTWNPIIAFPYFSCMLFGAYLRKFGIKNTGHGQVLLYGIGSVVFLGLYFIATKVVRGDVNLYPAQIIVQITLLNGIALFVCMAYSLENWFRKWPEWLMTAINSVAALTLEIYVIQKPIIKALADIVFPINWLLITSAILVSAVVLRILINAIIACAECGVERFRLRRGKE